ncbi:glycosyltransferase family 4 protein [Hyphomicrobium sp.]|uniref:glycosyltransferase family 4 protein n=1 Tax=Hyphomicrobium sp. TaxID=82 RepID=UPI001DEF46A6|nr:glycosyltransferase family 4 protein [Hyphomicrobium sp.]MBY0559351.1 glycosyltransferase family 4 protein [Hyphomicrobium sp.]
MGIGQRRAFYPGHIGSLHQGYQAESGSGFHKDRPRPSRLLNILTAIGRTKNNELGSYAAPGDNAAGSSTPVSVRDLEIVAPNFTRRLSGVTSTLERILPVLARNARIAALGPGLAPSTPKMSVLDLPTLWQKPAVGDYRIWHARRNIEMLAGVVLRDVLGFPLRLVFTSASQRHHTRWTRSLIARMDGLIATSSKTAMYLEHPATVIGHGINADAFHPAQNRAAARDELGLPDLKLVGCFGRIRPGKGSDVFVDAMLRVLASRPGVGAVLVGRATFAHTDFLEGLRAKIAAAGLNERLLILPEVGTSEMPRWYRALDIFVAPQRWEGFGVTPLEAMASGLPVVATTVGAFPEIVADDTGILVAPSDVEALAAATARLLDDPGRAAEMGAAGRARVATEFSIETEAGKILEVYRALLRHPSAAEASARGLDGLPLADAEYSHSNQTH